MQLQPVATFDTLSPADFKAQFLIPQKPVVIRQLAHAWPAYHRWTWDYLKELVGEKRVGIYNNVKSDAYTPINTADDYTSFGNYIDMIRSGPAAWRIFLFNIFAHAPRLRQDFQWPTDYLNTFVKAMPMLFVGGQGSITHMHFDIDLSHILHTQFVGRKRVLLFPYEEQHRLYRKPFEVLSLADFSHYAQAGSQVNFDRFPALRQARGYEVVLEHGDTLFMPGGCWHHMEYLESGFAMSLRALNPDWSRRLKGFWNIAGMRNIDTVAKKWMPEKWYRWKEEKLFANARRAMEMKTGV